MPDPDLTVKTIDNFCAVLPADVTTSPPLWLDNPDSPDDLNIDEVDELREQLQKSKPQYSKKALKPVNEQRMLSETSEQMAQQKMTEGEEKQCRIMMQIDVLINKANQSAKNNEIRTEQYSESNRPDLEAKIEQETEQLEDSTALVLLECIEDLVKLAKTDARQRSFHDLNYTLGNLAEVTDRIYKYISKRNH